MKRSIWKYELPIADEQGVSAPVGWNPLSVGSQDGRLCLWAEVDVDARRVVHRIFIRGTGHSIDNIPQTAWCLGTVQIGPFVWHVYDGGEK